MQNKILGLHHITAFAAHAQRNYDFYTKVLGLRLIKKTVNFDDPVWKWHRRLGHLGFQNMLKLLDSSTGMEITAAQIRA